MVNTLFGIKVGMTRYFLEEGESTPVTIVKAGPCVVIQKKTAENDGYEAIQVGFESQKESRVNKPLRGQFDKAGKGCFRYLREIRVEDAGAFELGQEIGTEVFSIGDTVRVSAKSKGRGFAGVVKRWGFGGGKATHGSRSHRVPGSIGASATPSRVFKGKKMPGRMGNKKTTVKNLKVVDVRPDLGVIAIMGAIPGSRDGIVEISKPVSLKQ
ncbi:MAG: 50S ribosomal protein L3 [Thermodesulfobacteriota bacterium]